ncbi:hypothetical protein DL96DRAFT_1822266 [Flagelloscypha sp. PMI_526]|nr:hypothetical protein DL96DRAFT_1822266 [Flagelloscypha sp. PMI_526]
MSEATLPPELWELVYRHLCLSSSSRKELLPFLLISKFSCSCIEPYIYETIVLDAAKPFQAADGADINTDQKTLDLLLNKPVSFLSRHVRRAFIPFQFRAKTESVIALLAACNNLTRLACWLPAMSHDDPNLKTVINSLHHLEMLEVNLAQLAFLMDCHLELPDPAWLSTLTHLSITVWDSLESNDASISSIDFSRLTALIFVVDKSVNPNGLGSKILATAPSTLVAVIVWNHDYYTTPTMNQDRFLSIWPCVSDPRLLCYLRSENVAFIQASTRLLNERPVEGFEGDYPFDDWAELSARPGRMLGVWGWATAAIEKKQTFFQRPTCAFEEQLPRFEEEDIENVGS